ncbi:MAG: DinB family protein, partial [Bacteroidota bacterium]
ISTYENSHKGNVDKVKALTEAELNSPIPWMVAPKQMGQIRRADVLWTAVMDNVHHRGQLSVYIRMAGAKLPSIYGPTADEPWM